jgi:acetyl esterase/lipase
MTQKSLYSKMLLLLICSTLLTAQETESNIEIIYKTVKDIFYYEIDSSSENDYMNERCRLDLYYPSNKNDFPTVVWFHAGGLKAGEKFIPDELKNKGIAVVAVNYRLYPKVKSPVYIEDAAASVAWVFENISEYGGDTNSIFVAGHSAGGYLTSMIGLDKSYLAKHNIDADDIAALIPYSGHSITHFTVREERGIPGEQPVVDELAPLFHVRSDAPPLIIITGDREMELLGRYEECAYLMRMMKVTGHKYTEIYEIQGFDHGAMAKPAHSILLKYILDKNN